MRRSLLRGLMVLIIVVVVALPNGVVVVRDDSGVDGGERETVG